MLHTWIILCPQEKRRVLGEIGKAEGDCFKTIKNFWINQVDDKWDKFMFQAKKKLSGSMDGSGGVGRPWFSLMGGRVESEF